MKDINSVPNVDTPTANQDRGVMRDDVTPGDGYGTPHRQDHYNDVYYAIRAILNLAGKTPDNTVEGVTASQAADSLQTVINGITNQRKNTNTGYTILDTDLYRTIYVDTTSADVTITLPLLANNYGRRIRIIKAKGDATYKVIIAPNATDANTLTSDALAAIWLPKLGDYIDFEANDTTGAILWQSIKERVTSQLRLHTFAGYGSTDTAIMQYSTAQENFGNMFSENHSTGYNSGTEGIEIIINRTGRYSFSASSRGGATAVQVGFSINSSQLTTQLALITAANRLSVQNMLTSSDFGSSSWSGWLASGSVIRMHGAGVSPSSNEQCHFTASYLGN